MHQSLTISPSLCTIAHVNSKKSSQKELLPKLKSTSYGGTLLNTRRGRAHGRPLSTRKTMHLVMRSTLATKDWSFRRPKNMKRIKGILHKFGVKYGVKILQIGNAGNHLHLHLKISNRSGYKAFIRATTSAIAMAVTGASRWKPMRDLIEGGRFWDHRPFSRLISGWRDLANIEHYITLNDLEGCGLSKIDGENFLAWQQNWVEPDYSLRAGP